MYRNPSTLDFLNFRLLIKNMDTTIPTPFTMILMTIDPSNHLWVTVIMKLNYLFDEIDDDDPEVSETDDITILRDEKNKEYQS